MWSLKSFVGWLVKCLTVLVTRPLSGAFRLLFIGFQYFATVSNYVFAWFQQKFQLLFRHTFAISAALLGGAVSCYEWFKSLLANGLPTFLGFDMTDRQIDASLLGYFVDYEILVDFTSSVLGWIAAYFAIFSTGFAVWVGVRIYRFAAGTVSAVVSSSGGL